jgi:hypothetical protein
MDQSTCWTFANILSFCKVGCKAAHGQACQHEPATHSENAPASCPNLIGGLSGCARQCEVKGLPILLVKPQIGLKTTVQFKSWLKQESMSVP